MSKTNEMWKLNPFYTLNTPGLFGYNSHNSLRPITFYDTNRPKKIKKTVIRDEITSSFDVNGIK